MKIVSKNRSKKISGFFGITLISLFSNNCIPAMADQDQLKVFHQTNKIRKAISKVKEDLPSQELYNLAQSVYNHASRWHVDPKVLISILKVESEFDQQKVSPTGDYSIAQINFEVWSKEFIRLNKQPLDKMRLVNDEDYAIGRMAEILSILKSRSKKDKDWFATYNSSNPEPKMVYRNKVYRQYKIINGI